MNHLEVLFSMFISIVTVVFNGEKTIERTCGPFEPTIDD